MSTRVEDLGHQVSGRRRSVGLRRATSQAKWAAILVLPACVGLALIYYALVRGLTLAVTDTSLLSNGSFVGLKNFGVMFHDARYWHAWRNTLVLVGVVVPARLLVGFVAAVALDHVPRLATHFRLILVFPFSCSVVAIAFVWAYIYDADGPLNKVTTGLFHTTVQWLGPNTALLCVAAMMVWSGFGYVSLLYAAALRVVPRELYEAAALDGASSVQRLMRVTLPGVLPTTIFAVVTGTIQTFQAFGEVYIIAGPSDSTLTLVSYIYNRGFANFAIGYAATMSFTFLVVLAGIAWLQFRVQKKVIES